MQLFSNLQDQYDQLWKYIIRPKRNIYPPRNLGPQTFQLEGKKIKRHDFEVVNPRGHVLFASHFIPLQQQTYPCVIYMHGNSSNRTEGMQYLGHLMRLNISLCTFDFSGCGNSQGDYISLGYYQQHDLHQIVKYIRNKPQISQIGIWGRSMGAVTSLLYLNRSTQICVAIVDSPFKSLKSLIQDLCKKNSKIPNLIIQGALKIIAGTIQQKANFDVYKINPLKYQVPNLKYPIFFIVGNQDDLIPSQHSKDLFQAYKGQNKILQCVKGNHNDSRPQECVQNVLSFLVQNLFEIKNINHSSNKAFTQIKPKQFDFFDDQGAIQNSSKQTQNIDFFSQQFEDQVKNYKEQFGQINFNLSDNQNKDNESFSLTSMFNNIFSTVTKENKQRNIDGYEKFIEKVSSDFQVEETFQTKNNNKKINKFLFKQSQQIKDVKNNRFEKQIIANLQTWAF